MRLMFFILLFVFSGAIIANDNAFTANNIFEQRPVSSNLPAIKKLTQILAKNKTLRAEFNQSKHIAVLKRPLISTGKMLYSQQKGLLWAVETPFVSTLRLSKTSMQQKSDSGEWKVIAEGNSQINKVTQVFLALLSGDVDLLSVHFELYFLQQAEGWTLGLIPKSKVLKSVMQRVILSGDDMVHNIKTWETNGDKTVIDFINLSNLPVSLTASETKLLVN